MNEGQGHKPQSYNYPEALTALPLWNPAAWFIPASASTYSSILLFVIVGCTSLSPEAQCFFRFPIHPGLVCLPVLLGTSAVGYACHERPGPLFPRLWIILLIAITALSTAHATIYPNHFVSHIGALAVAMALLALIPRILHLPPNSIILRWMALVATTITFTLATILTSFAMEKARTRQQTQLFELRADLASTTRELETIASVDWFTSLRENTFDESLEKFTKLSLSQHAVALEKTACREHLSGATDLRDAYILLLTRIQQLIGETSPTPTRLLVSPPVQWDPSDKKWHESEEFKKISSLAYKYFRHAFQLHDELKPSNFSATQELKKAFTDSQPNWDAAILKLKQSWSDHWTVFIKNKNSNAKQQNLPRRKLLTSAMLKQIQMADIVKLLDLSAQEAENESHIPNKHCHWHTYKSGRRQIRRLDCFTFGIRGKKVKLRAEVRIVYESSSNKPSELYYRFVTSEDYRREASEIMETFALLQKNEWNHNIRRLRGSMGYIHGFLVNTNQKKFLVWPTKSSRRANTDSVRMFDFRVSLSKRSN